MLLAAARQPRMVSVVSNYTMSNLMSFAPFFENIDCFDVPKIIILSQLYNQTYYTLNDNDIILIINNWLMLMSIYFRYIFADQMLITCPNCNIIMDLSHTKVDNTKIFYILSYLTLIFKLRSIYK